ncbi:MAG: beta-propeller fold lactonase family protein, partial [Bacteroidota bacterium]
MRILFIGFCCLLSIGLSAQKNNYYLLVGTYTKGNSEGIYSYQFNADSGTAKLVATAKTDNPSYLTVSNNEAFVYAVKEGGDNNISAATAYTFDKHNGKLLLINTQNTKGAGPCYITVDKQNKWVFTANYKGGSLSALGVLKDGSLD